MTADSRVAASFRGSSAQSALALGLSQEVVELGAKVIETLVSPYPHIDHALKSAGIMLSGDMPAGTTVTAAAAQGKASGRNSEISV